MQRDMHLRLGGPAVLAAAVAVAASCASGQEARPEKIALERGPYLQAVTSTSVTVCWRTKAPSGSAVAWGKDRKKIDGDPTPRAGEHRVTIHGLLPGESSDYEVVGTEGLGGRFTTAPAPGTPFRAVVLGDSGDGSKEQLQIAERIAAEKLDLVLHTGDVVYPKGDDADYQAKFFAPYGPLLRSHPVFCAIGNHDLHYSKDQKGEGYCNAFTTFANNPENSPFYYSFEWGDAKLVSLETDMLFKKTGAHLAWLERELASNTRRWLVVFMHVPLYSPGHHKDSPELQATVGPLLEKYRVPLVLAGHEHVYERLGPVKKHSQDPAYKGWWSVVTGGGGAHLDKVIAPHADTAKVESCHHYVTLEVSPDALRLKAVKIDGSTLDELTISHD